MDGAGAPRPTRNYGRNWFHSLEGTAEACANVDATLYLQKNASMALIEACASKPVRQAEIRDICETEQGEGRGTAE